VVKNCKSFEYKVQQLVMVGWLKFDGQPYRPDVNKNPLPNHRGHNVEAVNRGGYYQERTNVAKVETPLKYVCKLLIDGGYLRAAEGKSAPFGLSNEFLYHGGTTNHGHKFHLQPFVEMPVAPHSGVVPSSMYQKFKFMLET